MLRRVLRSWPPYVDSVSRCLPIPQPGTNAINSAISIEIFNSKSIAKIQKHKMELINEGLAAIAFLSREIPA